MSKKNYFLELNTNTNIGCVKSKKYVENIIRRGAETGHPSMYAVISVKGAAKAHKINYFKFIPSFPPSTFNPLLLF